MSVLSGPACLCVLSDLRGFFFVRACVLVRVVRPCALFERVVCACCLICLSFVLVCLLFFVRAV